MIRSRFRISGLGLFFLAAASLLAQKGGKGGGSSLPTLPSDEPTVRGLVLLPDKVVSERLVRVEELCGDHSEHITFADSKGRFSLPLVDRSGASSDPELNDCSIRASLAGYHNQVVPLAPPGKRQKSDLGELLLQPIGNAPAAMQSATDSDIPRNARKDFEKGLDEVAVSKWKDAIGSLQKAISGYPKFATAWFSLGAVQAGQNDDDGALRSYAQAIALDEKLVPPYMESAALESAGGQWAKVIEHTNKAIALAPDALPGAYYLNAMANFRLNQTEAAQKSVTEGLRVDQDHDFPDLAYIGGILLMSKGDKEGARKQFENYLREAPSGGNAGNAKQLLAQLTPLK